MEPIVEMRDIRKEFPGVLANDNVSITLCKGEVLALLGENGAGKSTLMSILFGLYQPDSGKILVRGREEKISGPNAAGVLGIGMVHQHFKLVHNFTVTENIILGMEAPLLNIREASRRILEFSKQYGLDINPNATIEQVSVGMQQRVEILKMLYRNAEVLIFDEPTAVLTPQETRELLDIMRRLVAEGKSIILITHKLREIKEVADRCTVIRRGRVVGTVNVAETSEEAMAEMMVGRQVSFEVEKEARDAGEVVLGIDGLTVLGAHKTPVVKGFSLDVRAGEIVGLAGVDGNGQSELVEAITGLRRAESGRITLGGADITHAPTRRRIRAGMAHIPEDRQKRALVLDFTLEDNFILELYDQSPYSKNRMLNRDKIRSYAEKIIGNYDVRSGKGPLSIARSMSGGNQQKAIVGREIELSPKIMLAVQPTRGLDVGSIETIRKRLVDLRNAGCAVLLVSLELDEIMSMSDRIAVICKGELVGVIQGSDADENEIGLMMTGIRKEANA